MAKDKEKMANLDLYGLMGLESDCTSQAIKKAFRRKALECHPDKNPDNPKAVELFHQLSYALEILLDESARAAYDKVLNARKAAAVRNSRLSAHIKKFKDDLEERERNFREKNVSDLERNEKNLQDEIKRLRKEGSRLLEEEISKIQKDIDEEKIIKKTHVDGGSCRLTIRWHSEKNDLTNGGYNSTNLHNFLSKYGDITALVISPKKKGRALVEYRSREAAVRAQREAVGHANNPLTLDLLSPPNINVKHVSDDDIASQHKEKNVPNVDLSNSSTQQFFQSTSRMTDDELERQVLQRLRQAQERKQCT